MDLPGLKPRNPDSHKGTYGRALLVGGSRGMTGAVALAGMAALRAGAGLVTLAVPDRCLETVAGYDPNYMTVPVPDDDKGRMGRGAASALLELSKPATNVGLGPGLARSRAVTDVVTELYRHVHAPMVVDADALNALATPPTALPSAAGPRILTPHVGEFRRLVGEDLAPSACRERARAFAGENGVIVVLKGHRTLVTDGTTQFENTTGNPGMATGGSGDVLTGVITALLGQDLSPLDAAILGVHVHGLAGDLARDSCGEVSLVAATVKDFLSEAFQRLAAPPAGDS